MIALIEVCQVLQTSPPPPLLTDAIIDTILTDSRKVVNPQSAIFVCINTAKGNGHMYIQDAFAKGVRCFLVSVLPEAILYPDAFFMLVPDTLLALQKVAAHIRGKYLYPVVGITGSNGKTIIKEWLFSILDGTYQIIRNPKSYNSQIGVAMSIWDMTTDYNLGIFEAGISLPNEMQNLQKMIQPTLGIYSNIGEQHSENFATKESQIIEKLQLFTQTQYLIYNSSQALLHQVIQQVQLSLLPKTQMITWGYLPTDTFRITDVKKNQNNTQIQAFYNQQQVNFTIPFTDDASIENILHGIVASLHLGINGDTLSQKLTQLSAVPMRLELKDGTHNCTLINDSYNNDIGAIHIALEFLSQQTEHKKHSVILSDILQSSKSDIALYQEVASLIAQKNIHTFVGIGPALSLASYLFTNIPNLQTYFYTTTEAFIEDLPTHHFANQTILLKGARVFKFEKINAILEARIHQTVLEVNLDAIANNYNTYRSLVKPNTAMMVMVKANSYGSGNYEIANKLQFLGAEYLAVAYTDEGILLRNHHIATPIMVMNPDEGAYEFMIDYKLEPEIYNIRTLKLFIEACQKKDTLRYPIHIKINSGMNRLGFNKAQILEHLDMLTQNPHIKIQSVFSHLAASDDPQLDDFTKNQQSIFEEIIQIFQQKLTHTFYQHLCNTSGIVRHPALHYNMVRIGIGLYGVENHPSIKHKIATVSRLKTTIAQLHYLTPGQTVGYNRSGIISQPTTIATICVGYADGIHRILGNGRGKVFVKGILCPTVGNVCMDMTMIDVSQVPQIAEGDEVILFGPELPITEVAKMAQTIAYEILTGISPRVKRIYFEE